MDQPERNTVKQLVKQLAALAHESRFELEGRLRNLISSWEAETGLQVEGVRLDRIDVTPVGQHPKSELVRVRLRVTL